MIDSNDQKTALVLLHGFCEDSSLWEHIIPELDFKGKIITPDLPGFGNSILKSSNFSLSDIATSIHHDLTKSGIESCICIGHSLGGYITLALKSKYPDFVTSIGLLHSSSFSDNFEKKRTRNKLIKFLDKNPASSFLTTFAPSLFAKDNIDRLKSEIDKVINMSISVENKTIQEYAAAMRDREDYSSLLYRQEQPLFIAGEYDTAIPVEDSKKQISNIKNQNNCHILENVAHMGMYESPSFIIQAINRFTLNNRS